MNYHICIIADHRDENGEKTEGGKIFKKLMSKKVWGLHPSTASRAKLKNGDTLLFYLGGKKQVFLGTAIASSNAYLDKSGESDDWFLNKGVYRVDLTDINVWEKPKPIKPLLRKLSFIKNAVHWGPYLQGGVRKIDESDFQTIAQSEEYEVSTDVAGLNINDFLDEVDLTKFGFDPHSLPAPERIRLHDLISNIEQKWKIPNFQRYFDWKKDDIKDFLESIFSDYYVGAFLLWKTEKESPLDLIPIKGASGGGETEYIILDGQQRMTALYYAVKSPDYPINSNNRAYFYIDFRKFLEQGSSDGVVVVRDSELEKIESFELLQFPFNQIERFEEWINELEDHLLEEDGAVSSEKIRALRRIIQRRLTHIWREFEIPYVVLPKTMKLPQVADIFERINTKGKRLDTFDLLIARLLKYGIQLRRLWEDVLENHKNIERYSKKSDKMSIYLFQTISLLNHSASSAKKEDILNIYETLSLSNSAEFDTLWNESITATEDALAMLENLRNGFGVKGEAEVPFSSMIPILAALLHVAAKKENKADCYTKIGQWYWSAVFTNAYSSAVESQMTADYIDLNLWFDDNSQIPRVVQEARRNFGILDIKSITSPSNAVYKGVLSLVALKGANDFEKNLSLELSRGNQKDHIFPKAVSAGFSTQRGIESVANMTWLSDETNNRKSAKKPSRYVTEFIVEKYDGDEDEFKKVLATHFVDGDAFDFLLKDDFEKFAAARERSIKREIKERIGIDAGIEDALEDDANKAVDSLEAGIRKYLDVKITESIGEDYWDTAITQGVRQRTKEKVEQRNKRHPTAGREKMSGLDQLNFCDVMDYCEIILANWGIFEPFFLSKREVEKHFLHLKDYRNAIKHGREMNNVERKQGEASMEWLHDIVS